MVRIAATLVAASLLCGLAQAATTQGQGRAVFTARGPAGLKIEGASEALRVSGDEQALVLSLSLRTLSTGIDLRDKHLFAALDVEHFPDAELRVARAQLKFPEPAADSAGEVYAPLTLHGQTRPVRVLYQARGGQVKGTARIDLSQFGIEPPSYLGVRVKPEVDIEASFHLEH